MQAQIIDKKIVPKNTYHYNSVLDKFEGKDIEISIKAWKNSRTLAQNRYLWAYYNLIEEEKGDFSEYLHEYFKRTLITPVFIEVQGQTIKIPGSTTKLSTKEFSDYITKIESITEVHFPFRGDL